MFSKDDFGTLEDAIDANYSREHEISAKMSVEVLIDIYKVIKALRDQGMKDLKVSKYMELLLDDEEYEAIAWRDSYAPFECHCVIKFEDGVSIEI